MPPLVHTCILSLELVALLVQCDVPLELHNHLANLGVISIGKLAFCVGDDKELIDELFNSCDYCVVHIQSGWAGAPTSFKPSET